MCRCELGGNRISIEGKTRNNVKKEMKRENEIKKRKKNKIKIILSD
jgi:hypothetical protein